MAAVKRQVKAPTPDIENAKVRAILEKVNTAAKFNALYMGTQREEYVRHPTGVLAFDTITGGGLIEKKYIEIWGAESCGKTTLTMQCLASVQRRKEWGVWVAGEEFDDDWAKKQGVRQDRLLKIKGLSGTEMLETAASALEELHSQGVQVGLLVLDSIQTIKHSKVAQSNLSQETYAGGGSAQLWGRFKERMGYLFRGNRAKCCIIGISQIRDHIGGFSPSGAPEPRPTQIHDILHWKSVSVQCKQGERRWLNGSDRDKRKMEAQEFKLQCGKNKTAPPHRTSSYWYLFEGEHTGIDQVDEAVRYARAYDLLDIKGPKVSGYGIEVKGGDGVTGVQKYVAALRADPSRLGEIRADVLEKVNGG